MEASSTASKKLASIELGMMKSTNERTHNKVVWSARSSSGCPVLVNVAKAIARADWLNAKWSVVRKKNTPSSTASPSSPSSSGDGYPVNSSWQALDRRRLLLVGSHCAAFEVCLPEPTVNSQTNAFFPVRLRCEVAGIDVLSGAFFVLHPEQLPHASTMKFALQRLDAWFMDPSLGLVSVIQLSAVKPKSLAAAFLRKHTSELGGPESPLGHKEGSQVAEVDHGSQSKGVRAKFVGSVDKAVLASIEKVYPVPVPIDDVYLLVAVSQVFHFTHESIHWVGDQAKTDLLVTSAAPGTELERNKLHVYGSIVPFKGMYQHSNPRLKKSFEVICTSLKVILACNGLPKAWLENDGQVIDLTDEMVKERKFSKYDEVFSKDKGVVFNANKALEALSKSVSINRHGALCIDYSVVIPVLVNTLSELLAFFKELTKSKLRDIIGHITDQLFQAQFIVSEIGAELAVLDEQKAVVETAESVNNLVLKSLVALLKVQYESMPLHLTQGSEFDCFHPPAFDVFDDGNVDRESDTIMDFNELIAADLTVLRLCIKGLSGAGKSTICRYIAREWARGGKVFGGKFDVILFVPLDAATTPAYVDLEQVSLADLVFREYVQPNEDLSVLMPSAQDTATWLQAMQNRILWVIDGVDALEEFIANPFNAIATGGGNSSFTRDASNDSSAAGDLSPVASPEAPPHRVRDLLSSFSSSNEHPLMKHRILTVGLQATCIIEADLFLLVRLFTNADIRGYLGKFFPKSDEETKGAATEGEGTDLEGQQSAVETAEEDQQQQQLENMSQRAKRIWLNFQKTRVLNKDFLRVPFYLELVCSSYLSDAAYNLKADESLADLFGRLCEWLSKASIPADKNDIMLKQIVKVAYSSMFKSKFACPTVVPKLVSQIPRELRGSVLETRFFEPATSAGRGHRFVHPRLQEYLTALFIAAPTEDGTFNTELLLRLKAKIINRSFHAVFLFLVGLVRKDAVRLSSLFDVILLDEKELNVLGSRGPSFVFRCFEETNFDRNVRSRVIDWFWDNFGKPRMNIWRSNFVINLLELIIFKLNKKGATEEESAAIKGKAVRAFGSLGMENARVMQILVNAARTFPAIVFDVVMAFKEMGTNNLSVIPVLLDAFKTSEKAQLKVVLAELRRLIVPTADSAARSAKSVMGTAAGRVVKIGMGCLEKFPDNLDLLLETLSTLHHWSWGDDSVLPLLVKCLETEHEALRRQAIQVVQHVDLLGPNVYYNERVIRMLESIGRKERHLRGDVVTCFLTLGMENDFVRDLLVSCVTQTEDTKLQTRMLLLCAQKNLRHPLVLEALSNVANNSEDQQARRVAIDVLAYIFIVSQPTQADINATIDTLYGLGLSSKFVTHRIVRMGEKKTKASHLTFADFATKYIA